MQAHIPKFFWVHVFYFQILLTSNILMMWIVLNAEHILIFLFLARFYTNMLLPESALVRNVNRNTFIVFIGI